MKKTAENPIRFFVGLSLFAAILALSQRCAAQDIWQGGVDANWMTPGNWQSGHAPSPFDSLTFSAGGGAVNNNFPNGTAFDGLTFGGSSFSVTGNNILLSGASAGNYYGVFNYGSSQTISINLSLDWGYYIFTGAGSGLSLNGTLTPGSNGVAFFDNNVASTSFVTDATGLIAGLGGQALLFNSPSSPSPTGLATVSGGSIVAYSLYTTVASGAVSSGANNNVELTASGAATAFTDNNASVNTITVSQAGNAGGTATDTLTTTGTLTLGQQGGIYALNGGGNKNLLTVTGGNLTAGTTPGATIVMAADGTTLGNSPPNMMTVSSKITDNPGGSVTVVKVGTGSMVINGTNTYSGGTYVAQGQVQSGNVSAFGTGPLYVASGATVFFNSMGTIANNIFISPGTGSTLWNGTGQYPGALVLFTSDGNAFFNGVLTLMGPAVPSATYPPTAGCRMIGDKDIGDICIFQNQITGPGTLDFCASPHADFFELSNNPSNHPPNNWQGGLIIEEILASPSSARNITVQLEFDNQIPNGANAGNVTMYEADTSGQNSIVLLDFNGHTNTINGLNSSSASSSLSLVPQITNSANKPALLTIGANDVSGNFNGLIEDGTTRSPATGPMNIAKVGAGTETFTSPLTYHGSTTVSNGTFALAGGSSLPNSQTINVQAPGVLDASAISGLTVGAAQTLTGTGTVNGSTVINGAITPGATASTPGILTNNGNVNFNGNGKYVWNITDAAGAAGGGFSQLQVINGGLSIGATSGSPFTIKLNGSPANFNNGANANWVLAQSANAIPAPAVGSIIIDTSSFGDSLGSGTFSVQLSPDAHSLVLVFNAVAEIPPSGQLQDQTANAGSTVSFTVTAAGAALPASYQWYQNGNPISSGGDPSGSGATITIISSGDTSTLTIGGSGVQDPDDGGYSVTVTDHLGAMATSSATLGVIDAPTGGNLTQSGAQADPNLNSYSGGSLTYLTATASSGTQPFTYTWSLNGNVISGATNSVLAIELAATNAGSYTVVIGNQAGSTSSTTAIGPVTSVPGQIIFEPFDSYAIQNFPPSAPYSWLGVTNLFNQLTGEPVYWLAQGTSATMAVQPNGLDGGAENQFGGVYPWPGLAGNSINECYWNDAGPNNHLRITTNGATLFAPGAHTNIYFSFLWSAVSLGNAGYNGNQDVVAGFATSAGATAMNYELVSQVISYGAGQYALGIVKQNGQNGQTMNATNSSPIPNVQLGPTLLVQTVYFVVGCYSVVSGGTNSDDTLSLWINPGSNTFYAATPPPPSVGPSSFGVKNSVIEDFVLHAGTAPASHRITDLRIGTTWASVTPPSMPTFWFANQIINNHAITNIILTAANAGNPVTSSYQWTFNNGSGPSPVTDTTLPDNAQISGSSTGALTITGATAAEEGTYSVTGSNNDPAPGDNSVTLTGSASTAFPPPLSIIYSGPNAVISWPPWVGYSLEGTPSLSAPSWTILGPSDPATVSAAPGEKFYQLVAPPSGH